MPEVQQYVDEREQELQGQYGDPVEVTAHEKVYQVDAAHYITLITSEANTYIDDTGEEKEIDLTLVGQEGEAREAYVPVDSPLDVTLPAAVTEEEGIRITNGEQTLELFPQEGSYGNAAIQDNAIRYNEVQDAMDVQYILSTTGLKEDIILREWNPQYIFHYSFDAEGYDAEVVENQVLIRKQGEPETLFVLSAPLMTDSDGAASRDITISLEKEGGRYAVTLDADEAWLSKEERAYPVKIDPTVTVPTESLIEVTTSTVRGTYEGVGYGYAGYITGEMTGARGDRYRTQPDVLRCQL